MRAARLDPESGGRIAVATFPGANARPSGESLPFARAATLRLDCFGAGPTSCIEGASQEGDTGR